MKEVLLRSNWLKDVDGGDLNQSIAITRFPSVVGRSSGCECQINHPLISRRHCVFDLRDGEIWVQDLGSLNGTFLNGERVSGPQPVHDGDKLDLTFLPYEVRLPKSGDAPVVQPGVPSAPPAEMRPHEVLVVDDNADAAEALAVLLQKWGHHVHVAHDGPQAVDAARAHKPDIVFLDIRLARENGCQVAQQLRTAAGLDNAILVGITGYDPDDNLKEGGFQRLLTKPVAAESLQEVLNHAG